MRGALTTYRGRRLFDRGGRPIGVEVTIDGRDHLTLPDSVPRLSCGFEWGYAGAGPSQLALAILLHCTEDRTLSLRAYYWFRQAVVECWLGDTWEITAAQIAVWLVQWRREAEATEQQQDLFALRYALRCGKRGVA